MEKTRLTLRLPQGLADQAAQVAELQGLTMNAFIVQAVRNWADFQGKRLPRLAPTAAVVDQPAQPSSQAHQIPKVGSNQPCPCGSGQKYKRCHGRP